MTITMRLSFPLHVTDEMYFMDGVDYLKTISEGHSRKLPDGTEENSSMMFGIEKPTAGASRIVKVRIPIWFFGDKTV